MGIPGAVGICPIALTEAHNSMIVSVLYFIFYLFYFIVMRVYFFSVWDNVGMDAVQPCVGFERGLWAA
jgi:hypothetical protein